MAQLAELFKDLSVLVIDQGSLLDSIEYNIEQTAVQMHDAVKELDVATTYALTCTFSFPLTHALLQLPAQYRPKEMHSSIANCHIWSDHSPHSQTPQTPYFGYDRNSGPVVMSSDITMFCCDDVVLALGPCEAASPHAKWSDEPIHIGPSRVAMRYLVL